MTLRSTVFVWVLALVVVVVGATIGTIAVAFDRSTRDRVSEDLRRSHDVALDLHAARLSLDKQECHVLAEEPRLRAVVDTEDISHETIIDQVRDLGKTIDAQLFVIVDANGKLLADLAHPDDTGVDLAGQPTVAAALKDGDQQAVWIGDGKAFHVAACRLQFGARVVGAMVVGHAIDDGFTNLVARETGGVLIVTEDGKALTKPPFEAGADELAATVAEVRGGAREVALGGTHWFAQVVPVPGYRGSEHVELLLLRSIDEALAPARRIIRLLLLLVAIAALATLILAFGLARRLSRPIVSLVARTQAIAGGDLAPRPVGGPTEVRSLGSAMNAMAKEIGESRTALADKERLARELEIAARIQTSILPRQLQVTGLELSARMMTATEVGGDYYDVVAVDGGAWLAVGDVSGHGLTAGLVMMMVQTGVATLVRAQPDANPRDVIKTLNRVVFENVHDRLEAERHMTLSLVRYFADGRLVAAGAHMDVVAWRASTREVELLATPGTFLAIAEDIDDVNIELSWRLAVGDVLVLLTDGVTEAENAAGEAFGYDRVSRILAARATERVEAIRDALFDAVAKHSPVLADDATVLVLRYVGMEVR
jgi:sigma-B regulation protein RsbU (phosphoserine phosphatase)